MTNGLCKFAVTPNDIQEARKNWLSHSLKFEHRGTIVDNPLLTSAATFRDFLREYSIGRTVRRGLHDQFRQALCSPAMRLSERLLDASGEDVDKIDYELRPVFGTCDGTRGLRSGVSKIAAFLRPDAYMAWDKYARMGLNRVFGRSASHYPSTYQEYLSDVHVLLRREKMGITERCAITVKVFRMIRHPQDSRISRRVSEKSLSQDQFVEIK